MRKRRKRQEIVYRRVGTGVSRQYRIRKRRRKILLACLIAVAVLFAGIGGFALWKSFSGENRREEDTKIENREPGDDSVSEEKPGDTGEAALGGTGAENPAPETGTGIGAGETPAADTQEKTYATDAARPRIKGIYVTGPKAGSDAFEDLLALVDTTELNAMVIDVKNDNGEITFQPQTGSKLLMGAGMNYIQDMEAFMEKLKEHKVYTIARIVCFKDPYLASRAPKLSLLNQDGAPVTDGSDAAWVNPYHKDVWDYLVEVGKLAGEAGFDEVQFDYVRFPLGPEAETAIYGVDTASYTKQQAITDFLDYAVRELGKEGIPVTADVFGTIIGNENDALRVGQDYTLLCETVAAVCPMVYPSHYANGVFGLEVPDAKPYETILSAMLESKEDLQEIPREKCAVVRPWLQAFTADWVKGHIEYGGTQIRDQIQAVYDAGYEEWILWNASNRYSEEGLLKE